MEIKYVVMNVLNAHIRFNESDHHKLYDGAYLTADEVCECRGACSTADLLIDNGFVGDYGFVLEDGSIEIGFWNI